MYNFNRRVTIDLHGMTIRQAEIELTRRITMMNDDVKQLTVIHGFNRGSRLLDFIRNEYRHPRIKDVKYTDNYGETIYMLY